MGIFVNGVDLTPTKDDVCFECVRLKGLNGVEGVLKPDNDGYYTLVIGGLNAYNSKGDLYDYDAAIKFFGDKNTSFQRRIKRGVLRSELDHPQRKPNMTDFEYKKRILEIHSDRVCGTIGKVWLSKTPLKDDKGREIVPIIGAIRPSGVFAHVLKRGFETKGEQVCFSIRSFTNDVPLDDPNMPFKVALMRGLPFKKEIIEVVTFDYVNEPGIYNAEKLLSPSLEAESLVSYRMTPESLISAIEEKRKISSTATISVESSADYDYFKDKLLEIRQREEKRFNSGFIKW